jgi:Zn-dependent peptidase ImmA (M78 family)
MESDDDIDNSDRGTTWLAYNFRKGNGLDKDSPVNIIELLYSIDVVTVFMPLSGGFSGMSQKTGDYRFMLINTNHSLARQNFTICHELYHLFYQREFTSMICSTEQFDEKDIEEYKADCFAADLLLPKFGLTGEIPPEELRFNSISLKTLLKIEHKFRCSRAALLYRLKNMKLIDSTFFDSHNTSVQRGAAEHGYSLNLYNPTKQQLEVIGNYGDLAKMRYDKDKISESHYISLLQDIGIDLDETIDDYVE